MGTEYKTHLLSIIIGPNSLPDSVSDCIVSDVTSV